MIITKELKQHQPVANGSPTVYETNEMVEERFLRNCQLKFPSVRSPMDLENEALRLLRDEYNQSRVDDETFLNLMNDGFLNVWYQIPYVPNSITREDLNKAKLL